MNVSLTPQLEQLIKQKVETGMYHSSSEVIREALRLLDERDRFREMKLADLRREIQAGLDSGPATPWNVEEFLKEAHSRHEQKKGE